MLTKPFRYSHLIIPKIIGASGQTPAGRSSFSCFISISWDAMSWPLMRVINVEWRSTPAVQNVMSHWSMTVLIWAMETRCKSPNAPAVRAKSNRQAVVVRRWRAASSQQFVHPKTCLTNSTTNSKATSIIIFLSCLPACCLRRFWFCRKTGADRCRYCWQ